MCSRDWLYQKMAILKQWWQTQANMSDHRARAKSIVMDLMFLIASYAFFFPSAKCCTACWAEPRCLNQMLNFNHMLKYFAEWKLLLGYKLVLISPILSLANCFNEEEKFHMIANKVIYNIMHVFSKHFPSTFFFLMQSVTEILACICNLLILN